MRVLNLVVARAGSKGVPNKNLRKVGGLSLVAYKTLAAQRAQYESRIVLSTDSPEIAEEGRRYGADVPFMRPAELATDTASSVDVIAHTVEWIEEHTDETYDALMLLQPSAPFTRPLDLDNAVQMMIEHQANVVVGMREVEVSSVFMGTMDKAGRITQIIDQLQGLKNIRRQDMQQEYTMNGGLYIIRWDFFKKYRAIYQDRENTYGYVMPSLYSVDIDSMLDLHWAEFLVSQNYIDLSYWQ